MGLERGRGEGEGLPGVGADGEGTLLLRVEGRGHDAVGLGARLEGHLGGRRKGKGMRHRGRVSFDPPYGHLGDIFLQKWAPSSRLHNRRHETSCGDPIPSYASLITSTVFPPKVWLKVLNTQKADSCEI